MKSLLKWVKVTAIGALILIGGVYTGYRDIAEDILVAFGVFLSIIIAFFILVFLFVDVNRIEFYNKSTEILDKSNKDLESFYWTRQLLNILQIVVLIRFGFNTLAFVYIIEISLGIILKYVLKNVYEKIKNKVTE